MKNSKQLLLFFLLASPLLLLAQTNTPFDTIHWDIQGDNNEWTTYKGKEALLLNGGSATLQSVEFRDGIVEWDMAFPNERGFTGFNFRITDDRTAENFYFRPHQSGKPDANQYCPIDNNLASWQLYHGADYSSDISYNFDQWFHVKMVISGSRAEVYIDDMDSPNLYIPFLEHQPTEGQLQLYASRVPTYFANFSYRQVQSPALQNETKPAPAVDENSVQEWLISAPFPEAKLDKVSDLKQLAELPSKWATLKAAPSGKANLATISPFMRDSANTVFAKLIVASDEDQIKALQIGFSDRARVFCNGQLLFAGDEGYRTRDFRFLGTMGYFHTIYLPLKRGQNEVWIAVSESFGGWGLQARWVE